MKLEFKVPFYDVAETPPDFPAPGDGQLDVTFWLTAGGSLSSVPLFFFGEVGYRLRTEAFVGDGSTAEFVDGFAFFASVGYTFFGKYILAVNTGGIIPFTAVGAVRRHPTPGRWQRHHRHPRQGHPHEPPGALGPAQPVFAAKRRQDPRAGGLRRHRRQRGGRLPAGPGPGRDGHGGRLDPGQREGAAGLLDQRLQRRGDQGGDPALQGGPRLQGHQRAVLRRAQLHLRRRGADSAPGAAEIAAPLSAGLDSPAPAVKASTAFHKHWSDGKAELSGYRVTTNRYGKLREGTSVLIYVTEPMNSRTWIKDDSAPADRRVDVIKLNHTLKFSTGIYPYSVMTSVFSPVDGQGRERFAPAKISFSAQE